MDTTYVGADSELGIGLQDPTAADTAAVEAAFKVLYTGGGIETDRSILYSRGFRGRPGRRQKATTGLARFSGPFTFEPTPEGALPRVLCSIFGEQATVDGEDDAPNAHEWKSGFRRIPATLVQKKGPFYYVYPGAYGRSLTLGASKTQDTVIEASVEFNALNDESYATAAAVGMDTAVSDVLDPFSPVEAVVNIGGQVTTDATDFRVNLGFTENPKDVFDGNLGARSYWRGESDHNAEMTMYFSSEAERKRLFGLGSGQAAPYGMIKTILPVAVFVEFPSGASALRVTFPQAVFRTVTQPIEGPDAIMQRVRIEPLDSDADGTDVIVRLTNTEAGTDIIAPSVAISGRPTTDVI